MSAAVNQGIEKATAEQQREMLACDDLYRTRDASGTPSDASVVGWNWIGEIAQQQRALSAALLEINDTPVVGGGKVTRLYRGTSLLAVATTFRDDMNFTVLVRWLCPALRAAAQEEKGNG